ncbi:flavin monoamine oxidase family protein [Lacrimispora celerecrescens]|uniref:Monoamine oxidase n=1 Tax=[Clostridium] celerecrescens 18A TaxID=1286362 RepID=A0A2M8Z1H5_9FIRM|nr:NAD(P)/FAD-dependent oxidoreductase [Lacrimispora celerecrescens]PJJ27282.1 monoamine oxidase [[Clostridium] celerecrescens 18A]
MAVPLNQVINPTNEQRREMIRTSLETAGRPEDYEYIVNLLSPPPDITNYASPGEMKGVKIGIIGGGLAGLSAAFELRKLGADITILEANENRIGGRVYTYYFDPEGKYYNEFGAHRIPVTHETTWHYINLLGLNTLPLSVRKRNNFLYVHNTRLRTSDSIEQMLYPLYDLTPQERSTPWPELDDYAFLYLMLQLPPEIRSELIQILPEYSPEYLTLTNYSVRQTLENLGLSQGAISLISGVSPGTGALLNVSYDEITHEEYTLDYRNIYTIEGGIVNLPYAFVQSLLTDNPTQYQNIPAAQLGTVKYQPGQTVIGIYQSPYNNQVILTHRNVRNLRRTTDVFDYVVCAIPYSTLREVEIKPYFSNLKMQAILEFNYINSQKTLFMCNKRFWEQDTDYGRMVGGFSQTDLPIQSIFYPGDHILCPDISSCSPDEPGVLVASYNYHLNATRVGNMSEIPRYKLIRSNVEEVHGLPRRFLDSIVEDHKTVVWDNQPNIRGAFAMALPGQKKLFAYEMLKPEFNQRVYFAGEHLSTKHGWMQGALYTGKEAANQLANTFHDQLNSTSS